MDALKKNLQKTREFLEEVIDIDFGLIDKLRSEGILSLREIEDIGANVTFIRRNSMLLDIISKKKKISELCDALKDTGQQHIVNYLNACGEYRTEFGLDWPLTELENRILNANQEKLVDLLDTNELLPIFYTQQVINLRQRNFIDAQPYDQKRNEALLGIVRRSSKNSYRNLIDCFRESKLEFIANILENGGVIMRAHVTSECSNLDAVEESIVEEMTGILVKKDMSSEQARRLLAATQLRVDAVKKGKSIVLFVSCFNEEECILLCKIIDDLKTRDVLQQLFNLLIPKANITIISMTILEKDMEKAMKLFENEKQEDMEQQLAESPVQRSDEKYAFHNTSMDLKKEKDSYEKSRMDWEKEKEELKELIRSLHMSQTELKNEKDSYERSRMDWEKEKKALIRSLHMSQTDLRKEKEKSGKERSAESSDQTKMEILPHEMLDMILLKTVRRMMAINSSEAFKSFDELIYQVLNHLRTISLLWDSRLHATKWVKRQLQRLRNTSKERDRKAKKSILDCYAIFVKDVDLSALCVSLLQFKVVKTEKLNDIFNNSSNNESRCRAFLDHLFIEGHPLAFLAMKQVLDGNKADILDYVDGRKSCTMTEEGSKFLSNDEIKAIVSAEDIYDQLMADMDPDRLGDWLKQERVITIEEWQETIASLVNIKERRRSTLEYLSTISHPRAYIILRQVLIQDNPKIASAIDNATSEAEKKYDTINQIMKYHEFLMERMDSEFGLLRSLRANGILTVEELEEIETDTVYRRLNRRLLDCISMNRSRNTADLFIEALKETDQGHLVNYMISDGVYDSKFAGEWPLTETEMRFIDSNYEVLVDLLDIEALLTMLYASDVINKRQREFISSKPTTLEKNEGFLEILRKTSQRNYKETIRCLRKSNRDHIAEILETGEGRIIALERKQNVTSPTHDRYSMRSHFRGLFVIINNETFKDASIAPRRGTEIDVVRLKTTFEQLGFEIIRYDNKTCIEMLQIMVKVKDLSDDYDCVAVAILTQGQNNNMICGVGKANDSYTLDAVLGPLKDIKKGIPKLIFIPACRGDSFDEGHVVHEVNDSGSNAEDSDIRVPMESDFLYHFATSPGYYSFRNATKGSIFIHELCNVFDEYIEANVEFDVVKSMIQVNRRVAENYESYVSKLQSFNKKKQMPSFVCMLRKSLFLKKQV